MCSTCYVLLHFCKASRKSLKPFSSYRKGTYIWRRSLLTMFKGRKLQKQVSELQFLCFANCIIMIYICIKFQENILNSFQVTEWTQIYMYYRNHYFQSSKGRNSKSRLTTVTVLVFCSSSHDALHLCEVSLKYLEVFNLHSRHKYIVETLLCSKGCNSKSRLTRVTLFVFCTLSHYIFRSFIKIFGMVFNLQSWHKYMVEMAMFNVQRAITPKVGKPEL